jgi:hypothetical protein
MKNDEDRKQIIDPMVNRNFIFDLSKSNNYNNIGFRMQKSTNDMLSILAKSVAIFSQLSRIFAKSSKLWA